MADILEDIVAWKRAEVARQKDETPPRALHAQVERLMDSAAPRRSMSQALRRDKFGVIAELKRRSPSKGWIKEDARPEVITPSYQANGAAALSVLTDEKYFGGSDQFLREARRLTTLPVLRKDFVVDEYQLFQARLLSADAVLLIAACLPPGQAAELARLARELGMETLLEIHAESELDYAGLDTDMLGVNNRDLGTFRTDARHSLAMAPRLPRDKTLVSESGISSPDTVRALRKAGYRGFLMGERFMRAANPGLALKEFIEELK